jgi:ABC-type transport system involved in multi-copper enzyme maturation permease subunit
MNPQVTNILLAAAVVIVVAILVLTRKVWVGAVGHAIPSIWRIAKMTVAEARRMRLLQAVVLLVVLIMASMTFFSQLSPREQSRMVISGGLSAITVFGIMMAIFIAAFLIPHEVEKRTIYAILSKPVRRFEFVLGKYLGALIVLAAVVAIMTVVLVGVLVIEDHLVTDLPDSAFDPNLGPVVFASVMSYFALAILTGVIILVSTVSSTTMTVISSVIIWAVGSMQSMLHDLASNMTSAAARAIVLIFYYVIPRVQDFDFRQEVANYLPVSLPSATNALGIGLLYTAVVLVVASIFFNDRQV